MQKVAIARIRRAAVEIRSEGDVKELPVGVLAKRVGCQVYDLRRYLERVSGLSQEIGVEEHSSSFTGPEYVFAAQRIRERGEFVTRSALSAELGKSGAAVRVFFERHPEMIEEIGLLSKGEATLRKRTQQYKAAITKLLESNDPVNSGELSRATGIESYQILKDFRKHLDRDQMVAQIRANLDSVKNI